MNVLIIGSGGREHAMADAVLRSPLAGHVVCAPGNAGTEALAENVPVDVLDFDALVTLARERETGLTIVGPEAPLCAGIVDRFRDEGLRIFGPTRDAARIEGDKAYAKRLMREVDVPTAEARVFDEFEAAKAYVASRDAGLVVKASGLAGGKGVIVCDEPSDAILALEKVMVDRAFGDAGARVVVEERLRGVELSVFAIVSARTVYVWPTARDHKPLGDGDTGPNTGGMGAYSPAPLADERVLASVERDILLPIVDVMSMEGHPYGGMLYAGLMVTPAGPKVLEFNCRMGDPEAQAVLPRIRSGFLEVLDAAVDGRLDEVTVQWDERPAVTVVMASGGYPGAYETGKVINGLEAAAHMPDVRVFHGGTRRLEHLTTTSGGRVVSVTALGDDLPAARRRAYEAVSKIQFENATYRTDIAARAVPAPSA